MYCLGHGRCSTSAGQSIRLASLRRDSIAFEARFAGTGLKWSAFPLLIGALARRPILTMDCSLSPPMLLDVRVPVGGLSFKGVFL